MSTFQVGAGRDRRTRRGGGSGRTEVAETVVGLRSADGGAVEIAGRRPRPGSVPAALAAGVGFVPQDRHHQGFVPDMSIADNATLSVPAPARHGTGSSAAAPGTGSPRA